MNYLIREYIYGLLQMHLDGHNWFTTAAPHGRVGQMLVSSGLGTVAQL